MANIKANIKNIAKIEKQTARNRIVKSKVKTATKRAKEAIKSYDENVKSFISLAHKEINTAVSKGVLHKNNGARKSSRLDGFAKKHQVPANS